jgi:hypothetical protein
MSTLSEMLVGVVAATAVEKNLSEVLQNFALFFDEMKIDDAAWAKMCSSLDASNSALQAAIKANSPSKPLMVLVLRRRG